MVGDFGNDGLLLRLAALGSVSLAIYLSEYEAMTYCYNDNVSGGVKVTFTWSSFVFVISSATFALVTLTFSVKSLQSVQE